MLLHTSPSPGSLGVRAAVCEERGYCEPLMCGRRVVLHSPKTRASMSVKPPSDVGMGRNVIRLVFDGRDYLVSVGMSGIRSLLCSATRRSNGAGAQCGGPAVIVTNIQFVLMLGQGKGRHRLVFLQCWQVARLEKVRQRVISKVLDRRRFRSDE